MEMDASGVRHVNYDPEVGDIDGYMASSETSVDEEDKCQVCFRKPPGYVCFVFLS